MWYFLHIDRKVSMIWDISDDRLLHYLLYSIKPFKKMWCSVWFSRSFQVVLSSDTAFVPQFFGLDSHGLCSLASRPNTDVVHLCGSSTHTPMIVLSSLEQPKSNIDSSMVSLSLCLRSWGPCRCCFSYRMDSTSIIPCWCYCSALQLFTG